MYKHQEPSCVERGTKKQDWKTAEHAVNDGTIETLCIIARKYRREVLSRSLPPVSIDSEMSLHPTAHCKTVC